MSAIVLLPQDRFGRPCAPVTGRLLTKAQRWRKYKRLLLAQKRKKGYSRAFHRNRVA